MTNPTAEQIAAAQKLQKKPSDKSPVVKSPILVSAPKEKPAKVKGPSKSQIEAALKLREQGPSASVTVDPDPMPTAPSFSGKDIDFPTWVQADMRYKEAYGNWMARNRRAS